MKLIQLGGHRYKEKPIKGFALIDDEDYERVNKLEWHLSNKGYAVRRPSKPFKTTIRMHRFIMGLSNKNDFIDHKDRNKLNNQKKNLRVCGVGENMRNRSMYKINKSGFKGVWRQKQIGRWAAEIRKDGKKIYLGVFKEKKEAAIAYNKAALELHGEFAVLNKI